AKANADSGRNAKGIPGRKANSFRSVATLALRLCRKCSRSSRKTCPERPERMTPLTCANSGSAWTQTYGYDKPGNRWLISTGPSTPTAELITGPSGTDAGPYDAANRLNTWDISNCFNGANCYDASGNLLAIP